MPYVKDNVPVYELVNGTILNVSLDKKTIAYKEKGGKTKEFTVSFVKTTSTKDEDEGLIK